MVVLSRPAAGFTLLELLVVMVLIGIMTVLAVPRLYSTLLTDPLKSSARRLIGLVAETSQQAVRSPQGYYLHLDLGEGRVWASAESEEVETPADQAALLHLPEQVRIRDVVSAHGGRRSMGSTTIWFSRKGYVDKTLIHLQDRDGNELTLLLSPFLAVTRIFTGYLELTDEEVR
ncbi:prepilin-type N-terminal cleavage/methylation domain-containing protein [Desulfolithobacter sp.]